jgi:hypothetical protein
MDKPKYIEYRGLKFCRDDRTGYYLNSTIRKRLHRYVWECEIGPIPKGCHIHHIDGDKANNAVSNLAILTGTGHQRLHGQEPARKAASRKNIMRAISAAPAWHRSEEGKRWHSEHMAGFKQPKTQKICDQCGKTYAGTKRQRFCSNACKSAHRRASGADLVPRICVYCGKEFLTSKYDDIRLCSRECTHKAHRGWSERKKSGG